MLGCRHSRLDIPWGEDECFAPQQLRLLRAQFPSGPIIVDNLPKFDAPPVTETVMGVEFQANPQWNVTHYGLFYSSVKSRYPKVELQPPLPDEEEVSAPIGGISFRLMQGPMDTRCWFIDPSDSLLLQVQANRFLRNWRRRAGAGEYPNYAVNRAEFVTDWNLYCQFLRDHDLDPPSVRQCEITYVNLLETGKGHGASGDLAEIFQFWSQPTREGGLLPSPAAADFKLVFKMPGPATKLHVALQNVLRVSDGAEMLQLTLTVRGRPTSVDEAGLLAWFDLGHEWIVRGFDELTTPKMHQLWKKRSRS